MNASHFREKFGKAILSFSLLFGIGLLSSATVQAQYPYGRDRDYGQDRDRDRHRDDRGRYGRNVYQLAQDRGYQDGLNTGASDARQGESYNPQRSHYYKNATYGYDSS